MTTGAMRALQAAIRAGVSAGAARLGEPALALLFSGLLTGLAFGAHLRPGGFYNDDWAFLVTAHFSGGFLEGVDAFGYLSFRPLMTLYWPAVFGVLGAEPTWHAAWTLSVSALMGALVFLLLRRLGVEALHAGLIAALVLLFPAADSTRFWPAMSANVLAVALYLAGVIASLAAFRATGRRALLLHAGGVALLLCSVLLYEIASTLILVTGSLYVVLWGRRGLWRWAIDVAAIAAVLLLVTSGTFYEPLPLGEMPDHALEVADQAGWVLADSLWAPASPSHRVAVAVWVGMAAVLAAAAWRLRRGAPDAPGAPELRRWLQLAVGALVATAAAYAAAVPSPHLSPLGPGQQNRANVLGGIGLVVLLYAVLMLAALVACSRSRAPARAAGALVVLAALVIGAGDLRQVRADQRGWERSAVLQEYIVDQVEMAVGELPRGGTVYTFGAPAEAAPGVPVFAAVWDLAGALALRYNDPSLEGYPVLSGSRVDCGRDEVVLHNANDSFESQAASYGPVYFVDVIGAQATRVADRRACRKAAPALLAASS